MEARNSALVLDAGPEAGDLKPEARRNPIRSFLDLEVYQITYKASIEVVTKIVPKLPREEQFDLADQLRRSAKAIPRLIAEGYSKKHQKRGFQKYLDDALAESNETIVSLSHVRDIYPRYIDVELCNRLIDTYNKASRMIFKLARCWFDRASGLQPQASGPASRT